MNENESRTTGGISFEERERRRNGATNFTLPERNGFLIKTITAQFVVCIILIASLLLMKSANPEAFEYFRGKFNSLMKRDITFEQMASAFKSVGEFVSDGGRQKTEEKSEDENAGNTDKAEKTETTSAVPEASGGEDLLKAQDKTTFSPIVISEKP